MLLFTFDSFRNIPMAMKEKIVLVHKADLLMGNFHFIQLAFHLTSDMQGLIPTEKSLP